MKNLKALLVAEHQRQENTIDLIASENLIQPAVLEALATPFANKYAEGYPGKRYYGGNEICDEVERTAIKQALRLFACGRGWHANVQPYSGSPANAAVYMALMNFGDVLMGLRLSDGGHLTHGHPVTFSGRAYRGISYHVHPATGRIDFDYLLRIAEKERPAVIVSGFSAYPRRVDFKKFHSIARRVGAYHVADISHIAGLVAAKLHPSPFPYADVVMTTTHKTLRGPRGAVIFCRNELREKIDRAVFPGIQGGPHMHSIYAKAAAFEEALRPSFRRYQRQIVKNAKALADMLMRDGFSLVSGGTDTHLLLIDLRTLGIDGAGAELALGKIGIVANRNSVPGDTKPFRPSGIRLGTPSVTSRGMKEREMKIIARCIRTALTGGDIRAIAKEVKILCSTFPIVNENK